jgi:glutamyl-tRNA(Gln) amidotransferase subunit D
MIKEFLKKNKLKESDFVQLQAGESTLEGYIIPSREENILMLKLKNGYNAGIEISKIKSIKKIGESKSVAKAATVTITKNPALPTISILHTGGTIASRVNYQTGGVYASFKVEDFITMFPEITKIANIESVFVSNMMSEDMLSSDYQKMAKAIAQEIKKGSKGIIIGHGTDTLAHTAAALSFMLENCPIPILIVGAQRSTDRGSTDAAENLICAAEFIARTDFAGVAVCMHETSDDKNCVVLPGTKTRKMHTSRRDAFKAINDNAIARINFETREITYLKSNYQKAIGKFLLREKLEKKVALLKTHVDMIPQQFLLFKSHKGLIIEATGLGHAPTNTKENEKNFAAIKQLLKKGVIVCMASQCLYGRVHPTVYTNLRRLSEAGVVFCEDMLAETAMMKLKWLLANYKNKEEIKKLMQTNLRGEINDRTQLDSVAPQE